MIELQNLAKVYNKNYVLKDINLKIGKGMNFILGPSGSGKTSLLKIISGLDTEYEGNVFYNSKNIRDTKNWSVNFNHNIGFLWQEDNLVETYTVYENITLPLQLHHEIDEKKVDRILKQVSLSDKKHELTRNLSGGQKKRVAIARELLKDAKIIFADEPTSSLDVKTAANIMRDLRQISKNVTLVIITHDESLIEAKDTVFTIYKGEIESIKNNKELPFTINFEKPNALKLKASLHINKIRAMRKPTQLLTTVLTLLISTVLLFSSLSGSIQSSTDDRMKELFDAYGTQLLDIQLVSSFFGASGTGGTENNPTGSVDQDISKLYKQFENDDRVQFISYLKPFNDISIEYEGRNIRVESSGNAPVLGELLQGNYPSKQYPGVAVPKSFVDQLGLDYNDVIGKTIKFNTQIIVWKGEDFTLNPAMIEVPITGVVDTAIHVEYEGVINAYDLPDSFIFSNEYLEDMMTQANTSLGSASTVIRTTDPEALISIKDELQKQGIVPLGRFELVEDLVRLNQRSSEQSVGSSVILGALAAGILVAFALVSKFMNKKESSVYSAQGFQKKDLLSIEAIESLIALILTMVIIIVLNAPINNLLISLFKTTISASIYIYTLVAGIIFILIQALLTSIQKVKFNNAQEKI